MSWRLENNAEQKKNTIYLCFIPDLFMALLISNKELTSEIGKH